MLGTCNIFVRLQSKVTSFGSQVLPQVIVGRFYFSLVYSSSYYYYIIIIINIIITIIIIIIIIIIIVLFFCFFVLRFFFFLVCLFSFLKGKENSSKETYNSPSSMSSLKPTSKSGSSAKSMQPAGFINKGITCYDNSILQILSVIPTLWNRLPSEWNILSAMLWDISLNMAIKMNSNKSVDPSTFLWALNASSPN